MPDKISLEECADIAEGYAILTRALGTIGAGEITGKTDHDLAKIIVDGEMKIRALLAFVIKELAK
jgi:hypothetical protein